MKKEYLWKSNQKENYIFFTNVKDYFTYLDNNNIELDFITKDRYIPIDDIELDLDKYAYENDIEFIYTDDNYPISFSKNKSSKTIINPIFFKKHEQAFKDYANKRFEKSLNERKANITIPNFIFSDNLLSKIINNPKTHETNFLLEEFTDNTTLTENQKELIKKNFLSFYIKNRFYPSEKISSKYLVKYYTIYTLKTAKEIPIELPISKEEINNLSYVGCNNQIILSLSPEVKQDELNYYNMIKEIFNTLKNNIKSYNITIKVSNRELLKESKLLENIPSNINLTIDNNRYKYDVASYQIEEQKLEKLISHIKNSNLSPFEKYIAIYNIVKNYKPYKESSNIGMGKECDKSRVLKYVLDEDNDCIVCEGFSKLLKELLIKVGIPTQELITFIDVTREPDYKENESSLIGHDRNLVKIDDDKYNIHGYYITDSTWDNSMKYDLYLNCIMTFDRKKEARRLEELTNEDILLDFHNFEEFQTKINFYLRRKIQELNYKTEEEKILMAYILLYKNILKTIKNLDYQEYCYLYDKYNKYFSNYYIKLKELDIIASNMLTEYANYILPLTNNKVSKQTILVASTIVKRKIDKYNDEEITAWLNQIVIDNQKVEEYTLPYEYDPNNKLEAYVKSRKFPKRETNKD